MVVMAEACRARCRQRHMRSVRMDGDEATDEMVSCSRGENETMLGGGRNHD